MMDWCSSFHLVGVHIKDYSYTGIYYFTDMNECADNNGECQPPLLLVSDDGLLCGLRTDEEGVEVWGISRTVYVRKTSRLVGTTLPQHSNACLSSLSLTAP